MPDRSRECTALCDEWNALTNPAKLRSDEEHAECRAQAARILAKIRRDYREGIDYREDEEGRMVGAHSWRWRVGV